MGTNVSKTDNVSLTNSINNSISEVQTDVENNVTSSSYSYQDLEINFGFIKNTKNLTFEQISDVTTKALLNSDTNIISELATKLSNKASADLSSTLDQTNKDLNFGATNVGTTRQLIAQNITNNMKSMIKTGIKNSSIGITVVDQKMKVSVVGTENVENITISQKAIIKSLSESIASTIAKQTATAVASNETTAEIKAIVKQKNEGLDIMAFMSIAAVGLAVVAYVFVVKSAAVADTCLKNGEGCSQVINSVSNAAAKSKGVGSYGGSIYETEVVGGVTDKTKNIAMGFIVFLIIVLCIQYYIHTQYMNMKENPIIGDMVNEKPPRTIFTKFGLMD